MKAFSRGLFWDVDQRELDPVRHRSFIIRRVLRFGDLADFRTVRLRYGAAAVRRAYRSAPDLDPKSRALWSLVLGSGR